MDLYLITTYISDSDDPMLTKKLEVQVPLAKDVTVYDLAVAFRKSVFEILGVPINDAILDQLHAGIFGDITPEDIEDMPEDDSDMKRETLREELQPKDPNSVIDFQEKMMSNPEFASKVYKVFVEWLTSED